MLPPQRGYDGRSYGVPTTLMGAEDPTPEQQTPPQDSQESDSPVGKTAEEVDAAWRHRVSQKDKAHAAAEAALRDERDALKRQLETASRAPSSGQSNGETGADAYLRDQLAEAKREAEQERTLRAIESKRAKYPALSKQVGSDSSIFAADDATLARLNALADDDTTPFAPTTPRKAASVPAKSLNEMDKAELEAELKRAVERGAHRR
jgi:hypothetical protein